MNVCWELQCSDAENSSDHLDAQTSPVRHFSTLYAIGLSVGIFFVVACHSCSDFPEQHMEVRPDTMRGKHVQSERMISIRGLMCLRSVISSFCFYQSFVSPASAIHESAPYQRDGKIVERFSVHWTAYWISARTQIYTLSSDFRVTVFTVRFNLLPKVFPCVVNVEQVKREGSTVVMSKGRNRVYVYIRITTYENEIHSPTAERTGLECL